MRKVSLSEFAKIQGVSKARVSQWRDEGRLVLVPVSGRKHPLVNVEASVRLIAQTTDMDRATSGENAGGMSLAVSQALDDDAVMSELKKARLHRERQEAQLAELKLKVEASELVEAALVDRTITTVAADIRLALERLPARVSSKVAALSDRLEVEQVLLKSVDEVLEDLAESIRSQRSRNVREAQEDVLEASL